MSLYRYFSSSTGKKFLMAFSGFFLFGFIVTHLAGNLRIFGGPEALNDYSNFLKEHGDLLWAARTGLIVMVVLHIWAAVALTLENMRARPVEYASRDYIKASYASRTMHWSGLIIFFYIGYHLMHFTFVKIHPEFGHFVDAQGRRDVYRMVVSSFQLPPVALLYITANLLLGVHMSHGIYSMFQSLGLVREDMRRPLRAVAHLVGYGIFLGYASIPLSVWLGVVR